MFSSFILRTTLALGAQAHLLCAYALLNADSSLALTLGVAELPQSFMTAPFVAYWLVILGMTQISLFVSAEFDAMLLRLTTIACAVVGVTGVALASRETATVLVIVEMVLLVACGLQRQAMAVSVRRMPRRNPTAATTLRQVPRFASA